MKTIPKTITSSVRLTPEMSEILRKEWGSIQHYFEFTLVYLNLIPESEFKGTRVDFEKLNKRGVK